MAYRSGERRQAVMFPASVEEYVAADDPVRAYDAFVEQLDFGDLGIEVDSDQVGPPAYDPQAMVKLLVYGYSYGLRSSRKLERASHHNVSFVWLLGGLQPDLAECEATDRAEEGADSPVHMPADLPRCLGRGLHDARALD